MPVPIAPTAAVAGQAARAGVQFNNLAAQVAFLLDPPVVSAYQTVAQTIPSGIVTPITMDAELVDTDNVHSLVTNTSRLTIVTAGRYRIIGQTSYPANATGLRSLRLAKSGTLQSINRVLNNGASVGVYMQVYDEIACVVGDYLELHAEQTSGVGLALLTGFDTTFLKARWCGNS